VNTIGRMIFYDLETGDVLVDTYERVGMFTPLTADEQIERYKVLSERNRESFGVLELDYGALAKDFAACNGYRVDIASGALVFSYPDPANPEQPPVYRKPLSEEVETLKAADLDNKEAIATLYELMLGV